MAKTPEKCKELGTALQGKGQSHEKGLVSKDLVVGRGGVDKEVGEKER